MEEPTTIATYPTLHDAELAQNRLEDRGIPAFVARDDAGGAYPQMQLTRGVRLMVRRQEADEALALLGEIDALPDSQTFEADDQSYEAQRRKMWRDLGTALLSIGAAVLLGVAVGWFVTGSISVTVAAAGILACVVGTIARRAGEP